MRLRGSLAQLQAAFGTRLERTTSDAPDGGAVTHWRCAEPVRVPAELGDAVIAVLGLDDRPQARAHFRIAAADPQAISYAVPESGRGVPDVAAVADPQTGYRVYVDGQAQVIGGTSAVAPLWAALTARLAEAHSAVPPPLGGWLYRDATAGRSPSGLRDINHRRQRRAQRRAGLGRVHRAGGSGRRRAARRAAHHEGRRTGGGCAADPELE